MSVTLRHIAHESVVISFVKITGIRLAEGATESVDFRVSAPHPQSAGGGAVAGSAKIGSDREVRAFNDRLAALERLQGLSGKTPRFQVDLKERRLEMDAMGPTAVHRRRNRPQYSARRGSSATLRGAMRVRVSLSKIPPKRRPPEGDERALAPGDVAGDDYFMAGYATRPRIERRRQRKGGQAPNALAP